MKTIECEYWIEFGMSIFEPNLADIIKASHIGSSPSSSGLNLQAPLPRILGKDHPYEQSSPTAISSIFKVTSYYKNSQLPTACNALNGHQNLVVFTQVEYPWSSLPYHSCGWGSQQLKIFSFFLKLFLLNGPAFAIYKSTNECYDQEISTEKWNITKNWCQLTAFILLMLNLKYY